MKNLIPILILNLFLGITVQAQEQVERDPLLPAEFKTQKQYAEHVLTNAPIIIQGHIIKYEDHATTGTVALVQVDEVLRGNLKKGLVRMYFPKVTFGLERCMDCGGVYTDGVAITESSTYDYLMKRVDTTIWPSASRFFYFSKISSEKIPNYEDENLANKEVLISYRDDYYSYVRGASAPNRIFSFLEYAYGFEKGLYMPMLDFYRYLSKFPNTNQAEAKAGAERLKAIEAQAKKNQEALSPKKSYGGSFGDGLNDEPIVITATEQARTPLWTNPDIEVEMNNGRYVVDASNTQWWVFDVSASVVNYDNPAAYVNTIPLRFNFNTAVFGTNLYTNNNIFVYMHDDLTETEQATYM